MTATPTTSNAMSSMTAGDAVIADIQEIEKGLTDLPQDILKFVMAVEHRLEEVESMLASILSGADASTVPAIHHHPTTAASATSQVTTTSQPSLCRPPGGAGPLVPCPGSRHTTTRTTSRIHTITENVSYLLPNHTSAALGTGTGTAAFAYPTAPFSNNTVTSTSITYVLQPSPSPYTFRADADDNVAVYYGTTADTQPSGLLALCEDPNVDFAILSFVFDFFGPQDYPSLDFGPGCSSPNTAQLAQAPGLMNCTALAPEIAGCQEIGKKILVSLGGYTANSSFASDDQATDFATTLWHLFGAGTDNPDLRPFGTSVVVDGFDIDNENHNTSHYETFANALRQQFTYDESKTYYLSAAPQCPMPDMSIPMGAMAVADFVWVQFYNNPSCNLGSDGFQSSFSAWSANLSAVSSTPGTPRLYVGAGAFQGAGTGYVNGSGLSSAISLARELNVSNFGGMMLWDGSEGMANVDEYGVDYLQYAKAALQT